MMPALKALPFLFAWFLFYTHGPTKISKTHFLWKAAHNGIRYFSNLYTYTKMNIWLHFNVDNIEKYVKRYDLSLSDADM